MGKVAVDSFFDLTAIQEGELDPCSKSMIESLGGTIKFYKGYSAIAKDEEESLNLELFVQALNVLKDAISVEVRLSGKYPLISVKAVDEATEDLIFVGQFVLLEGSLSENAAEWLHGMGYAVKIEQGLVAIAQVESDLPEANLMYAMYAAYLDLPIETWAIITKKD